MMTITDLGMPAMIGRLLAEEVRRVAPTKPVILLTGFALGPEDSRRPWIRF